jgi:hypothetical protein
MRRLFLALTLACLALWPHAGARASTAICSATGLHAGDQYSGGSQQIPNACACGISSFPGVVDWLESDLGITLNVSAVSAWADQSGLGNNAVQATGAAQPSYTASDANWNGKPSLTFAAGQFMSIANAASLQIVHALTLVAVLRSTNVSGLNTIISKGVSGIEFDSYYSSGASPKLIRGGSNQLESTPIISVNTPTSIMFTTDQVSQQAVYLNGVSAALQANAFGAGTSSSNAVRIGERSDGSTQLIGSAVMYVIANQYWTASTVARFNGCVAAKYGAAL